MSYDDTPPLSVPRASATNDDACIFLIGIFTLLMVIMALPSMWFQTYSNPVPAILALGFASIALSLLYLSRQVRRVSTPL